MQQNLKHTEDFGIWTEGQLFSKGAEEGEQLGLGTVCLQKRGTVREWMHDAKTCLPLPMEVCRM